MSLPLFPPRKSGVAKAAGADETILYGTSPFDKEQSKALADAFKAVLGPNGADVIYDAVGGDYCEPVLRSIAWEGRYLVVGFPAGIPKLPFEPDAPEELRRVRRILGCIYAARSRGQSCQCHAAVPALAGGQDCTTGDGGLSVRTRRRRHREMGARGAIGKLVVRIGD